ncbi:MULTISPECIES: amidohydrolase [unclassified Wenzhouxiangella]|uniref:amidohydrolase n=1 Tax=unclassified Wenzhouxiangella TaxID=2613841 RepID=UPI000E32A9F0|nr:MULTISPECIES: amidohydrolase [unclassified Wenzhouxiangella]RFF28644.1 amidohydrolase [Wenzhouxiangella sp. 15181]RFP68958.1 amidohydrolase [Wenzhouxiangella sp. 15190]
MIKPLAVLLLSPTLLLAATVQGQDSSDAWHDYIDQRAASMQEQVVEWRRHFHAHPELSNREFDTAETVAEFLRSLDMEVTTGVAHTGVVGVLRGGQPGPVVGLRADMDALPVPARADLPFSPDVTSEYLGEEVPVSHACGHDSHMAMLMGVAQMLAERREELPGTVKFIFQPAEEGTPPGEEGGAEMMVAEGVLSDPDVDVIFGQHIWAPDPAGQIGYRPAGTMAASDQFNITVHGSQTHGSTPWTGVDPITTAAQIVLGLNTIVSRQTELTKAAAVISVGRVRAGVRNNIIPEEAELIGTIRTLDPDMRDRIHADIRRTAEHIAASQGAEVTVDIQRGYPVTYNDPELTEAMAPSLQRVTGDKAVRIDALTAAEDFSYFQREVPGLYFFLGAAPEDIPLDEVAPHHTPDFQINEKAMQTGVQALATLTLDYMLMHSG